MGKAEKVSNRKGMTAKKGHGKEGMTTGRNERERIKGKVKTGNSGRNRRNKG